MSHYKALLLLGPTGSGKTPLGSFCEKKGLMKRNVFHFDFGSILRDIEKTGPGSFDLATRDVETILQSLKQGTLLEDENFHIAKNIILTFVEEKQVGKNDLLMLNGFPRHVGQARNIEFFLDVNTVLSLECSPKTVFHRILQNSGGDRSVRTDDSPDAIKEKLELYRQKTLPLLDYYRQKAVFIKTFHVDIHTRPEDIHQLLNSTIFQE